MARLTDTQRDNILADFHIGKSQNELAKKYQCSPATVNKICKGVVPKYKEKVNAVVSIKSELQGESEYQSECFDKEVNERLRRQNLVYGFQENAVKKASDILEITESAKDLKDLVDAVDKASITLGVSQRHANSQVNIQNTNATQNNIQPLTEDEAKSKALALGVPLSALM